MSGMVKHYMTYNPSVYSYNTLILQITGISSIYVIVNPGFQEIPENVSNFAKSLQDVVSDFMQSLRGNKQTIHLVIFYLLIQLNNHNIHFMYSIFGSSTKLQTYNDNKPLHCLP